MADGIVITNPSDFTPEAPGGEAIDPHEFVPDETTEHPVPGKLEATVRGVKQGVTLGFGDELAGALGYVITGGQEGAYTKARDEARAADAAAKEAHGGYYLGGELAGGVLSSLIPGAAVAKGAGLAAAAGRAALTGAAAGLGSSDAELADSENRNVGGALVDTAVGAGLGGALGAAGHGVGQALEGAQGRIDKRLLSAVGDKAPKNVRDRIAANADEVKQALADRGITLKTARNPEALAKAANASLDESGSALGAARQTIDDNALGVKPKDIVKALRSVQREYAGNPDQKDLANQMRGFITQTLKDYGSRDRIPIREANALVTRLENKGFTKLAPDPGTRKELQAKTAAAIEGVIQERLAGIESLGESVKGTSFAARPGFEGAAAAAEAAKKLPALNQVHRAMIPVAEAAESRSLLTPFSETGLRSFTLRGLAEKLWNGTAGKLTDPADQQLARIVKAAKAGSPRAVAMLKSLYGAGEQAAAANAPALPGATAQGLQYATSDEP